METQWALIIFTLLISFGAGTLGVLGVLNGLGKATELQLPALITAVAAVFVGGVASFLHLQHWDRAFNGFGNPSSGITQELVAVGVFVLTGLVYLVLIRRGGAPAWYGWLAALVSVVLVVVMAHSYNMAARPVWDTPLLWLYYLANAVFFGGLAVALLAGFKKQEPAPAESVSAKPAPAEASLSSVSNATFKAGLKVGLGGAVLTLLVLVAYLVFIPATASSFTSFGYYFDPTHPTQAMINPSESMEDFATGSQALLFWGGAVAVGVLVPLLLALFCHQQKGAKKETEQKGIALQGMALLGIVCALTGGVCFRVMLYQLGYSVFAIYS